MASQWVPHFLDPTHDLGPEHHNVPIDMPAAVSEAYTCAKICRVADGQQWPKER